MAVLHGGQLARVATQYQIPEEQWIDLSTGIAPFSYPIPDIPSRYWQQLPVISEDLIDIAKDYYNAKYCWPLSGSQQLIEKLPALWANKETITEKHVYLPRVGYKEHQHAWKKAGYLLHFYQSHLPSEIEKNSVVVVINPNNPLTDTFSIIELLRLQNVCQQQHALLIIDEAFADICSREFSFVAQLNAETENVIVLRSFGKFFGLAGVRIGFVCTSKQWCEIVKQSIGPWSVNGPALYIAEVALNDLSWQKLQREQLLKQSRVMQNVLATYLPTSRIEVNALFITVFADNASAIYQQLCQQAVYVRLTDENDALRFGIANELQLKRLTSVLSRLP